LQVASANTAGGRSASAKEWRESIVVGVTKPIPGSGAMKPRRPRNDDKEWVRGRTRNDDVGMHTAARE
jgi:hypothetical protein